MDNFNNSENPNELVVKSEKSNRQQKTLEEFTGEGFRMLVEATKKSNKLPFGKSRDLYESFPSFHNLMQKQSDYILSLLSMILTHTNLKRNIQKRDDDDKVEIIIDVNDALLENVGISLDELSGVRKNPETKFLPKQLHTFNGSWNKSNKVDNKAASQVLNMILNKTKNIEKPQVNFEDKINNDPNVPFEPRIKYKYNMLKPLGIIAEVDEDGICQFSHPYEFEIMKFKPSKGQLQHQDPKPYKTLEETPFHLITTPNEVALLVEDLEKQKEIAIDLEHHSYRSFQGFTCLMQISTRDTDYVIDTLSLRSELQILNKIFTDPSIVKVFHGADSDIPWLQKDLSLYVVNMFDTHKAAKMLYFPKLSLAYLLSYYCNVNAQKHFQLADWRIRPLPEELLLYAREDTHYLLYIYDNLRNSLIDKAAGQTNLLEAVISESSRICLKRYMKPLHETDGYLDIYQRSKKLFDNRQKYALKELFDWRDSTARNIDESYAYVLPNHMMLNISEVLPREAQGILACCNPIPVPVGQNLLKLHQIILKAREQPLIKPILEEQSLYKYTTAINSLDNPLQCPHDLNHDGEFRDDLPVLFNVKGDVNSEVNSAIETQLLHSKPIVDIFEKTLGILNKVKATVTEKPVHLSPYHRYKQSKKYSEFVEAKKLKENNLKDQNNEKNGEEAVKKEPAARTQRAVSEAEKLLTVEVKSEVTEETDRDHKTANKRKEGDEGDAPLSKRIKKEKKELVKNPLCKVNVKEENSCEEATLKTGKKRRKMKKKVKGNEFRGMKEKKFQPFDYNSVDFEKYRTASNAATKDSKKPSKRTRRKGKKNFKISV